MVEKATFRQLTPGEYGAQYANHRGTCYICSINQDESKLIKVTAHEMLILELYCKATNNTPPRGYTYFCKDRTDCDKWVMQRNAAISVIPAIPAPVPYHPKPSVTIAKRETATARSRNKYG